MRLRNPLFVVAACAIWLAGCGGGSQVIVPPPAPTFTSTPSTAAVQGAAYMYQIAATDPLGKTVSYALTSGPTGATLNGNTLTWTPTAAESRVTNAFGIMATTAEGGRATQTWSVTPTGTVTISRVNTIWTASGSTMMPFDWTKFPGAASGVAALVPQADGTLQILTGTGSSDGSFTIPNVPGGYYWLRFTPVSTYWTSSSNFDDGTDTLGNTLSSTATNQLTSFVGSVNGLDPWASGDYLDLSLDNGISFGVNGIIQAGATMGEVQSEIGGNLDFTTVKSAVIAQMEPLQLGKIGAMTLGPSLQLSNLSLINGGTNTLSGMLVASPESTASLTVQGSDWADLYENAAGVAVDPFDTSMSLATQPYFTGGIVPNGLAFFSPIPPMFYTNSSFAPGLTNYVEPDTPCSSSALVSNDANPVPPLMGQAPILTDTNFGSFQYGDPFPQAWLRAFLYCQRAVVNIPDASSNSPAVFVLADEEITGVPIQPLAPLVGLVENPMINGGSLFVSSTLGTGTISLNWSAPSGSTPPSGYEIDIFVKSTITLPPPAPPPGTLTGYIPAIRLFTTKTSATVPFMLRPGQNFLVEITAKLDGKANFESSPLRSGLPIANTSVISAVMTVSASAPAEQASRYLEIEPPANTPRVRKDGRYLRVVIPDQQ